MDNRNHNTQPYQQTKSKMKTKTYGSSSYKCHQCRVPLLMVAFIVTIELLLFTNVSHCANAKSYVLHWNTTNPLWVIFFAFIACLSIEGENDFISFRSEKSFRKVRNRNKSSFRDTRSLSDYLVDLKWARFILNFLGKVIFFQCCHDDKELEKRFLNKCWTLKYMYYKTTCNQVLCLVTGFKWHIPSSGKEMGRFLWLCDERWGCKIAWQLMKAISRNFSVALWLKRNFLSFNKNVHPWYHLRIIPLKNSRIWKLLHSWFGKKRFKSRN